MQLIGRQRQIGLRLMLNADCEQKNAEPLEPANRRFLESMSKRGINVGPWLRASQCVSVSAATGQTVQLGFATDTLDVLIMGLHFDTCLSPTSFNYFSSVANASDINKQVLYCRDEQGKVLGRCLFAINGAGQVQTFQRYCHH